MAYLSQLKTVMRSSGPIHNLSKLNMMYDKRKKAHISSSSRARVTKVLKLDKGKLKFKRGYLEYVPFRYDSALHVDVTSNLLYARSLRPIEPARSSLYSNKTMIAPKFFYLLSKRFPKVHSTYSVHRIISLSVDCGPTYD